MDAKNIEYLGKMKMMDRNKESCYDGVILPHRRCNVPVSHLPAAERQAPAAERL